MVSTEDAEIASLAIKLGAKIPFKRSVKNASDHATTADVIHEVLTAYHEIGRQFDFTCCIYATAPFTTSSILREAKNKLVKSEYDSVLPLLKFGFPIQRAVMVNNDEKVRMVLPEYISTRSQDLPECYHDAGQFYFLRNDSFLKDKKLYTENTGAVIVSELEAHDIDSELDWTLAEMKFKLRAHEAS